MENTKTTYCTKKKKNDECRKSRDITNNLLMIEKRNGINTKTEKTTFLMN